MTCDRRHGEEQKDPIHVTKDRHPFWRIFCESNVYDRASGPAPAFGPGRRRRDAGATNDQWGAVWVGSGGLGGGVDDLSSLKMPAILPKKLFFFCGSGF